MRRFMRNKLVGVERPDEQQILVAHGFLDDDLYGLQVDLSIKISTMTITAIEGKWNRWTTPECRRSTPFLQEAVGLCIEGEGFHQEIQKTISRKGCRHYANLILECCDAIRQAAALLTKEGDVGKEDGEIPLPGPAGGRQKEKDRLDRFSRDESRKGVIIDLHVHTSPASPCSSAPADRLIEEARLIGLDGICFTDHNHVWDPGTIEDLRQRHGFLVLRGNEVTTDQGDILVFGLDEDIHGIIRLEELREMVLKAEGYMIAAHPFRGFLVFGVGQLGMTPEKAMDRPLFKSIDALEVLNSKVTEKENRFSSEVAEGLGLPATGGSDAHDVSELGIYATRFSRNIKNEDDLLEALKSKEYAPVVYRRAKERG